MINVSEYDLLKEAEAARDDRIQVDSFALDEYMRTSLKQSPMPDLPTPGTLLG